jgi:uncharacterized membrane protein
MRSTDYQELDSFQRAEPPRRSDSSLSDLVGGRLLAWVGGVATLVGIVLFLVVAISRGWLGVESRVLAGGVASALLMAGGAWLYRRRGRTEASVVLVGAGTAGLFATLLVAGEVYGLIAPLLAVAGSMLVGALATFLAIRWAGRAIGALGLLGALVSPLLVGAPSSEPTMAIVAGASGFATWVVIRQSWGWLGLAALLAAAAQWGPWILNVQSVPLVAAGLVWFGGLGIAAAVAAPERSARGRPAVYGLAMAGLNVCLLGLLGGLALDRASGEAAGDIWLGALAAVHLGLGLWSARRLTISEPVRRLLIVAGVILGDAAFGRSASGIGLAIGWGMAAIGFAWLTRRHRRQEIDSIFLGMGIGAHIALALIRVLLMAPPSGLVEGDAQVVPLLSIAVLAGTCLVCGSLTSSSSWRLDIGFNALGLAAIAYLTAQALTGSALVVAWALEAAALMQLARQTRDPLGRWAGLGFLGLAALHVLIIEAPPTGLVTGLGDLATGAIALGAVGAGALRAGQVQPAESPWRRSLLVAGAGALLYLGSVAIITVFQPTGPADAQLLDLSIRQEGQVLLSACWSLAGLIALIIGLRRNQPALRNAALGLLLLTVGKVFMYDLSTLTSLYRVVSFIALGLLLLAGAFAYQRLRPAPLPDMRSLDPSRR